MAFPLPTPAHSLAFQCLSLTFFASKFSVSYLFTASFIILHFLYHMLSFSFFPMTPFPVSLFPASSPLACFSALFPQFLPLPYLRNAEINRGSFSTRGDLIFASSDFREVVATFVEKLQLYSEQWEKMAHW